jgi:hypothetical protein
MSRYGVEKACFALQDGDGAVLFKAKPDEFLARYPLTAAETAALKAGDIGFLYKLDVAYGALGALSQIFRYDQENYVARLRAAAGLPESPRQIEILRRRNALRRRG